jgi:hypothetical protein
MLLFHLQKEVHQDIPSRCSEGSPSKVWNMRWATDNPDLFAIMEKTRMYIARKPQVRGTLLVRSTGPIFNRRNVLSYIP